MNSIVLFEDNTSPSVEDTIRVDELPFNLTGSTVHFQMRAGGAGTLKVDALAVVEDAAAGKVRYDWQAGDTDTVGGYRAWWRVTLPSGGIQDTLEFDVEVLEHAQTVRNRDLCTLEDIAERTPGYEIGDDPATDAALADFITKESRDFMEVCRREITPITPGSSTRVFDVDWIVLEERELLIGDAATVTGVVLKGQEGTVLQTLDPSAWVTLPRVREDWEPISAIYFRPLVNDPAFFVWPAAQWGPYVPEDNPRLLCEVTGTWGFPKIPDTVKRAVAVIVLLRYLNDAASVGTKLADAADRAELNLAGSLRAALDTRDRFRIPSVG